jgi:hypothetical protein
MTDMEAQDVTFHVDDQFHSSSKVAATSPAARGLWVTAGSWSSDHKKGGFVPSRMLADLGGSPMLADELCKAGLWKRVRRGYQFVNWEQWNDTPEQAERRQEDADRKREMAADRQRRKRAKDRVVENSPDPSRVTPGVTLMSRSLPSGVTPPEYTGNGKLQVRDSAVTRDRSVTSRVTSPGIATSDDQDLNQDHLSRVKRVSHPADRYAGVREKDPQPGTPGFRLQVAAEFAGKTGIEIDDSTADAIAAEVLGDRKVPHKLSYVLTAIRRENDPFGRWLAGRPKSQDGEPEWCGKCEQPGRWLYNDEGQAFHCPECSRGTFSASEAS